MMTMRTILIAILPVVFSIISFQAKAQKDTEFWFVAPEISQNNASNFDRPVAFRFSTYGDAAVVTVTQPANPAFPPQIINIAANASGILQFPPFFDNVENIPPNTVLNKGFLIQSTSPITAYYELIGGVPNNPEIFSLKGKNALGNTFYTPFQNVTDNSSGYSPLPHAAFDIVATENNTLVTITPTRPIVGHAANVPFNITLNRGQTYSAEATSQLSIQHPAGSKIVANKPVAVTVKDDLLEGGPLYGGFCRDVMGDQIVPVEKLGTRHVVHKGFLDGDEFAFVVATVDATQVKLDGVVAGTINAGQTLNLSITDGSHFIESTAPVYVLQMTGNNCELAGEIMPALDCSGSTSVRFVRSTEELFYLFLTTQAGWEDGFLLNGNANIISPGDFQVVPGSNGQYVSAAIIFSEFEVPTGVSSVVSNSQGVFQMGFLNGGVGTGCRFGFFSDFGIQIRTDSTIALCPGETINIAGNTYSAPASIAFTLTAANGCDSVSGFELVLRTEVAIDETIALCPDETILLGGQGYFAPATVNLVLPGLGNACDTLATYNLTLKPQVSLNETITLCPGETTSLGGQNYAAPTTVNLTLPGLGGSCDTLATYVLILKPQVSLNETIALCPGETTSLGGQNYAAPATINLTLPGLGDACDTLATYVLTLNSQPTLSETIEFCPGETITLAGTSYTQPATVILTLPSAVGCDTISTYVLVYLTPAPSNVSITCPGNVSVITPPGTGPFVVNYPNPTAASDCPCPGLSLTLTTGLPSGSLFPPTSTPVCFQAVDSCGQTAACCFVVTVREEQPCDVKTIGCMKYELLNITADAGKNRTYRIRVTNFCANKMIYTAIQIPDGMIAISPAENSIYTAPTSGREYLVRNPNFSPFYSVRFKSTTDSIANGEFDVLRYTLPAQADPTYIHIISRLEPQIYHEAHLNTFNCPIGITPPGGGKPGEERAEIDFLVKGILLFPNPTSGALFADLTAWAGQDLQMRILDSRGQTVVQRKVSATSEFQSLELPDALPNGLYFLEIITPDGERERAQFVSVGE